MEINPELMLISTFEEEAYFNFRYFKNGDETGFNYFYKNYSPPLQLFGEKLLKNSYIVEELLHDAFLHTWELRHIIDCPRHLYYFVRLRLKWGCYRAYKTEKLTGFIYKENMDEAFVDETSLQDQYNDDKELLNYIYKAIPLLPPSKSNIMKLYFRYGLSCKEISRQYNDSVQSISRQLQESIGFLKALIRKKKTVDVIQIIPAKNIQMKQNYSGGQLEGIQLQLFKLRYEKKYSFERIAYELGMEVQEVQQKYVAAHRLLNTSQQKKQYMYG